MSRDAEARAREVLADAFEDEGLLLSAASLRKNEALDQNHWARAALAAMLSFANTDTPTEGEAEAEVQRILAMTDDEILAEANVSDVAWARGFKQGLATGKAAASPKVASDTAREAIPTGMKRWDGGDSAPADWDGGDVLYNNGQLAPLDDGDWTHCPTDRFLDVIAYTPRPVEPTAESDALKLAEEYASKGDWNGAYNAMRVAYLNASAGWRAGIKAAAEVAETCPLDAVMTPGFPDGLVSASRQIASAIRALASSTVQTDEVG